VSTASALEITLKFKIIYGRLVRSATPAAVPDDTEVIPPECSRAKAIAKKTQRLCASARDHSARKATAHTGLP
jgi:hypothetical protein